MIKRRIAMVIYGLEGGGAEYSARRMAAYWHARGHDVRIFTLTPAGAGMAGDVPVTVLPVAEGGNVISRNLQRMKALRVALLGFKADAVISFMEPTNVLALLAARGTTMPVIVADRVDAARHSYGLLCRMLRNLLYPFAAAAVVQTERARRHYPPFVLRRGAVIPNAVYAQTVEAARAERPVIAAMGRLDRQKGFDLLLEAFAGVDREFPAWDLHIWGQGDEYERLKDMAKALGVAERVVFKGYTRDPAAALAACDIFVLSSRYEGFPNVLLEAMAQGRAVIAADCDSGPSDIIRDGDNGMLVAANDAEELRRAMRVLMRDGDLRARLGTAALGVCETYAPDKIMGAWDRLMARVISARK